MRFNEHYRLEGRHALLSPSKSAWTNYSDEKFDETIINGFEAARGSQLHELAAFMIKMGVSAKRTGQTFNSYVNDAIGFKMTPEVTLYHSDDIFGTADTIAFVKNKLRIFDLKTGKTPAGFRQLEIYAALFCLEYLIKPSDISIELRIYQNDEIKTLIPEAIDILHLMDTIRTRDKRIKELRKGGELP